MRSMEARNTSCGAGLPTLSGRGNLHGAVPRAREIIQLISCLLFLILVCPSSLPAQSSSQSSSNEPSSSQSPSASKDSDSTTATPAPNPKLEPPRSDRVNINDMGNTEGESSSKNTQIDLSPPADDAAAHPRSADAMDKAENPPDTSVSEMHAWNPHKAAKDIEVGDFYFKRKNYRAAESRYREALYYKNNDADATFRLAICLEKMNQPDDAIAEFQSYLRILPHGSKSEDAQKAIERLSKPQSETKAAK